MSASAPKGVGAKDKPGALGTYTSWCTEAACPCWERKSPAIRQYLWLSHTFSAGVPRWGGARLTIISLSLETLTPLRFTIWT